MTVVHNASTTLPATAGTFDIPFSGGTPFTYTGGGLYVAYDWGQYTGTKATVTIELATGQTCDMLQAESDAAPPATLECINLGARPETRLSVGPNLADAGVRALYSLGSLPRDVDLGRTFQARVTNDGNIDLMSLPVTLSITGADSFTDTQIISLPSCTSTTVTFAAFTPSALGSCSATVSVPGADGNSANDSLSHALEITPNICSYQYPGPPAGAGIGSSGGTAELVARFNSADATEINSVIAEFARASAATYRVTVYRDDGSGAPGAQLYLDSADRTIDAAGTVTIALPGPIAVGPGDFFVGVRQTNTVNMTLGISGEQPLRPGTFFVSRNGGAFSDFAPGLPYKPNIGAVLGACPTMTVSPSSLPSGTAGVAYSDVNFSQTGSEAAITWSEDGALPTGMSFSAGVLSGTPTQTGSFPITVTATDANSCTGSQSLTLTIDCPTIIVSPSSLANGTAGVAYTPVTFNQTSGVGAIGWTETGTLPAGMGFDASTATLSGTPTQTGSFPITVTATDANSCTGSQSLTLVIACPPIDLAPSNLPGGTVGTSYTQSVTASSGIAPYTYEVTSGALPTGLTLSSGGLLAGSPLVPGTFDFTVTATDANRCAGSRAYTVGVVCPTITVSPASLPSALEGNSYTQTLSAGPLSGAYAFTAPPGSLPPGLALDPTTGTLTGIPTAAGTFPFVVTATHVQSGCSGTRSYSIAVTCPTIAVLPAGLPTPVIGLPYSQQFSVTGTSSACTYAVTAGTLPAGLSLSPSGLLSGTPISTAVAAFTVTATDAGGCTGSRSYTVSPANLFFQDDQGRSRFCLNAKTGDYVWQIMAGPAAGLYAGVANIINGGARIISKPGATQTLNVTYDALRRRASGYFFTASGAYSGLADSNTSNNTGGCS